MSRCGGATVLGSMVSARDIGVSANISDAQVFWAFTGCCRAHLIWDKMNEEWACTECGMLYPKIGTMYGPGIRLASSSYEPEFLEWLNHWTGLDGDVISVRIKWNL